VTWPAQKEEMGSTLQKEKAERFEKKMARTPV